MAHEPAHSAFAQNRVRDLLLLGIASVVGYLLVSWHLAPRVTNSDQDIAMPNPPPSLDRPRIVLFGDSLTERSFNRSGGWGAALADYYSRKADVVNRGFGGYNTRWAVPMLPHIFPRTDIPQPPILATVFFGANDAAIPERMSDRQHVPLEEYQENLRRIVHHIRFRGIQNIVVIAPPPVYEPGRLQHQKQIAERDNLKNANTEEADRTNNATGGYAAAAMALAAELGVQSIDLWTSMQDATSEWSSEYLIPDGLHLSTGGNAFVFEKLRALIEQQFPDIKPDALAMHMPPWFQVDPKDPHTTIQGMDGK